jgi:CRISPR-associated protein Cas1
VGLDPYEGFYHSDRAGRPALALDLMEQFRSAIGDSIVLNLMNREMVSSDDFRPGQDGGVLLTDGGMRTFLRRYSARLQTTVRVEGVPWPLTYQKLFEVQARRLRKVIEGEEETYVPFQAR